MFLGEKAAYYMNLILHHIALVIGSRNWHKNSGEQRKSVCTSRVIKMFILWPDNLTPGNLT